MSGHPISLQAPDGFELAATWFAAPGPCQGVVLVVPAMGVTQKFYAPLAGWLSERGFAVLTFDYRGIGRSRRQPLRELEVDLLGWARLDAGTALAAALKRTPGLPVTWIGHSLGGQILPFVPGHEHLNRIVTVATGSGYWLESSFPLRLGVWLLWYVIAPASMRLYGYFPGRRLGMVGDLPRGVMEQWRSWCLHPEYAVGAGGEDVQRLYARVTTPIFSFSFTDDEFMSWRNIQSIHGHYGSAPVTLTRIAPREVGVKQIGHFGFFRPTSAEALWVPYLLAALPRASTDAPRHVQG